MNLNFLNQKIGESGITIKEDLTASLKDEILNMGIEELAHWLDKKIAEW